MRIETTGLSNHCSIAGQFSFLFFLFFVFFFLFLGMFRKLIVLVVVLIQMSAKYLLPLLLKIHVYFAKILVGNCLGGNLTREPNSIPVRQFGYPATTFTDLAT